MDAPHSVEEVMTYPVVAVRPGVAVDEVARQLIRHHIGAAPVVDASLRVLGVVAESDVLMGDRPGRAFARDVMSSPALTVTADTTLGVVRALLSTHRIGRLPVVDREGRLVGIVCRRDLLVSDLPTDDRIRRRVIDRAIDLGAEIGSASVERGTVRVRARVARRSEIPVLRHQLRQVRGVIRLEADLDFDIDDIATIVDSAQEDAAT
jgi:CBS domain-containing protein